MGGCRCCSALHAGEGEPGQGTDGRGGRTWPGHGRPAGRRGAPGCGGPGPRAGWPASWPNGTAAVAARRGLRGARRGAAGGVGCMVRTVGAQGCGRRPEKTMNMMSMEELAGKEKTKLGKASNGHGVEKRKTRRRRGRRGLPSSGGGGGYRRKRTRWPEKLAEEFAGNLAV